MPMMPHGSIPFSGIPIPASPMTNAGDTRFKNKDEQVLYAAYKRNLDSAEALAAANKFHDAWILLNISIECFLKHIYILLRPEFEKFAPATKKFPLGPLDYDGIFVFYHFSGKDGGKITMKDFGHEVMVLWQLVWTFTDLNGNSYLSAFKNHLPSQADWVNARYERANHAAYQTKYQDYYSSFQDCLNNPFRSFQ